MMTLIIWNIVFLLLSILAIIIWSTRIIDAIIERFIKVRQVAIDNSVEARLGFERAEAEIEDVHNRISALRDYLKIKEVVEDSIYEGGKRERTFIFYKKK